METKFSKLNISDKVSDKDLKILIQKTSWNEYLSFIGITYCDRYFSLTCRCYTKKNCRSEII